MPKSVIEVNWLGPADPWHHKITTFDFIGHYDVQRPPSDPYKNAYNQLNARTDYPFERLFYEAYDIPYIERINSFTLYRNVDAEEKFYATHVREKPYICAHAIQPTTDKPIVQLGESTDVFFDAIRVLQHASEIHVLDSVWAAICYMLDGKYSLLQGIPVYVYCQRDFRRMFTQPVTLPNWTMVEP